MAADKTIGELEKQRGVILVGANPNQKMSQEQFDAIDIKDKVGVDHKARVAFLEANGYKVTRENMINPDLSVKE
jgi:hypothetical protein